MPRKKIGEILVEKGLLTPVILGRVLSRTKKLNKKIGSFFEDNEIITSQELAEALAEQHGYRVVHNIVQYAYSKELLKLVPEDAAMQHMIFPLKISGNNLSVAIADPTDTKYIKVLAENNNYALTLYVTTRQDILAAISKHYMNMNTPPPNCTRVLIVDDNTTELKRLSDILTKEGYQCSQAKDGVEGFKCAILELPDVIITDKEMPKLDGYKLNESLKAIRETANIPVILITGTSNTFEEKNAFDKDFFDYIHKPFNETSIVIRVKRALKYGNQTSGKA